MAEKRVIKAGDIYLLVDFDAVSGSLSSSMKDFSDDLGNDTMLSITQTGVVNALQQPNPSTIFNSVNINNKIINITMRVLDKTDLLENFLIKLNSTDPFFSMQIHETINANEVRQFICQYCVVQQLPEFSVSRSETVDNLIRTVTISVGDYQEKKHS